jgi:hypothetical protein
VKRTVAVARTVASCTTPGDFLLARLLSPQPGVSRREGARRLPISRARAWRTRLLALVPSRRTGTSTTASFGEAAGRSSATNARKRTTMPLGEPVQPPLRRGRLLLGHSQARAARRFVKLCSSSRRLRLAACPRGAVAMSASDTGLTLRSARERRSNRSCSARVARHSAALATPSATRMAACLASSSCRACTVVALAARRCCWKASLRCNFASRSACCRSWSAVRARCARRSSS